MPHTYETYSVGNSREGRPMPIHIFKSTGKENFRIFFYAQVHGIENDAGNGANIFIDDVKLNPGGYYNDISIAVLPVCNVDGKFHQTYTTPIGWDMDIDSMARYTPENRNLFGFVKTWKPQVTVDMHTLNRWFAGCEYMESRNYARAMDHVAFKLETQDPRHDITWKQYMTMFKTLNQANPQYIFEPFWDAGDAPPYDGSKLLIEYYTPDIALIYQFMASRYNTVGFLTEAIDPQSLEGDDYEERSLIARQTHFIFLKNLVKFCKDHPELMNPKVCPLPQGTEIPVRWQMEFELKQFQSSLVQDRDNGSPKHIVSDQYRYKWQPTEFVTVPLGYAYPDTENFGLLTWYLGPQYDFELRTGGSGSIYDIETIHIINAEEGNRFENVHKAWQGAPENVSTINIDSRMTNMSGWVLVFCDQEGGHMLPKLLEPKSQFALTRYYEDVGLLVEPDTDYVVKRLIKKIA